MSTTAPPVSTQQDLRAQVIRALENDKYDWRTVKGIASEVGIPEDDVVGALGAMPDLIVRVEDANGRSLFTTRAHYEKTHGFGTKLLSALADKVVA